MEAINAPLTAEQVADAFGSSSAAADFLGIRLPSKTTPPDRAAAMRLRRQTFTQSYRRWTQGRRTNPSSWFDRLQSSAARQKIINEVSLRGLRVSSYHGWVDLYGTDNRERDIDEEVMIRPDELANAGGWNFFEGVRQNNWTQTARAVSTAWFYNYVGNDLGGGDAVWTTETEMTVDIP